MNWLSEAPSILALGFHLFFVCAGAGLPLINLYLEWRIWQGDLLARRMIIRLSGWSLVFLLAGITLGVGYGIWIWSDTFSSVVRHLGSRIAFGLIEALFSIVLLAIHAFWCRRTQQRRWEAIARWFLLMLAATNLLYHFPFLFEIIAWLNVQPSVPTDPITSAEFRQLLIEPQILSQTVHFWFACLVVAGVIVMVMAERLGKDQDADDSRRAVGWGAWVALVGASLQLPIGGWVLVSLPRSSQMALLGGAIETTLPFAIGMSAALLLLYQLIEVVLEPTRRATRRLPLVTTIVILLMMSATCRQLKSVQNHVTSHSASTAHTSAPA